MDNAGTVLEHVVLSMATGWACARRPDVKTIGYVDTHAMAPVNEPIDTGAQPRLVTDLVNAALQGPVAAPAPPMAQPYMNGLGTCAAQRAAGIAAWYPSHCVHAIWAAQARKRRVNALLFENDAAANGRRHGIAAFLAPNVFGLSAPNWHATLAPEPGDFRDAAGWAPVAQVDSKVLVIMSDPMQFVLHAAIGMNMGPDDLDLIQARISGCVRDRLVHVIFVTSNLGHQGVPGGPHPYHACTQAIAHEWVNRMVPAGAQHATAGLQWGGFLVFLGVYDRAADPLQPAFSQLTDAISETLRMLWRGALHVWQ